MTESAKQAYQMVPLVPEVLPGAHKTSVDKANPFRTDIVIVGPDELKSADYGSATDVGLRLVSHRDGLKIGVGMARDFAGQREQLVSILRQHFGSLEHLFVSDHIPLDEAVEQQITPMLAHAFSGIVGDTVNGMSVDYLRAYAARNLYTRIRQISAFSIGFCAVVDIPPLVEQHAVDPVAAGFTAGFLALQGIRTTRTLKKYLKTSNSRERALRASGDLYENIVSQSVHDTFCAKHFDAQAERLLSED